MGIIITNSRAQIYCFLLLQQNPVNSNSFNSNWHCGPVKMMCISMCKKASIRLKFYVSWYMFEQCLKIERHNIKTVQLSRLPVVRKEGIKESMESGNFWQDANLLIMGWSYSPACFIHHAVLTHGHYAMYTGKKRTHPRIQTIFFFNCEACVLRSLHGCSLQIRSTDIGWQFFLSRTFLCIMGFCTTDYLCIQKQKQLEYRRFPKAKGYRVSFQPLHVDFMEYYRQPAKHDKRDGFLYNDYIPCDASAIPSVFIHGNCCPSTSGLSNSILAPSSLGTQEK